MRDSLLVFTLVKNWRKNTVTIAEIPAPKSVFDRFARSSQQAITEEPGTVYVELYHGRTIVSDRPLMITLEDAVEFLSNELGQPESVWGRCYEYENAH